MWNQFYEMKLARRLLSENTKFRVKRLYLQLCNVVNLFGFKYSKTVKCQKKKQEKVH